MPDCEDWRPVVGYEGLYEVSSLGRVRRLDRMVYRRRGSTPYSFLYKGGILKLRRRGSRRPTVDLEVDGECSVSRVIHLVLDAFEIDIPADHTVGYVDGDWANCSVANVVIEPLSDPGEQWRDIPSAEGYQASTQGRVRSLTRSYERAFSGRVLKVRHFGRILNPTISRQKRRPNWAGYPTVNVERKQRVRSTPVHHLVAEAFHGPRPRGKQICHFDGNSLNPMPCNLYYGSQADNDRDKYVAGFARLAGISVAEAWKLVAANP